MSATKRWLSLGSPGGFSSSKKLSKAGGIPPKLAKDQLQGSIAFQLHRNANENFPRRSAFATYTNERWEADLGDMGSKISPEISGISYKEGGRKQLLFLVCVDVFSRRVYAAGLLSKSSSEIKKAFQTMFEEAKAIPKMIETDDGTEFRSRFLKNFYEENEIRHVVARGANHARLAERNIRNLKRVLMAAAHTDMWPNAPWKEVPFIAAQSLNKRESRNIGTTPEKMSKDSAELIRERGRQWSRARFVSPSFYNKEEGKIKEGKMIKDGNKYFKNGTLVLIPIPKLRRNEIRDKEGDMHYEKIPYRVEKIFHGRRPYLYFVRSLKTGRKGKRLFYGRELVPIKLNIDLNGEKIDAARIKEGIVEYKIGGSWKSSKK